MTTEIKGRDTEENQRVTIKANHLRLWFADFTLHANVGPAGGHNHNSALFRVTRQQYNMSE